MISNLNYKKKQEIIETIKKNPELIDTLSTRNLQLLSEIYAEKIEENNKKLKKVTA